MKNNVVKNTVTNYLYFFMKTLSALIITRLIYDMVGEEGYGLWALMWSLYGYTLLLDFGLGWSVQKSAAEFVKDNESEALNRKISTIFSTYTAIATVLIITSIAGVSIYKHYNPDFSDIYANSFLVFSIGASIIFPTGLFSEILVGLGKHYLRNYIRFFFVTSNLIGVSALYFFEFGILELTVFTIANHLIANVINYIVCKLSLSSFKMSYKYVDFKVIPEIASFSFNAYIVVFSGLVLYSSDQFMINFIQGLSFVGIYQIATRLPMFFKTLNEQFQENIFPYIVSKGSKNLDPLLLITLNKLCLFSSFFTFAFAFVFTEDIFWIWLNIEDPVVVTVARVSLVYTLLNTVLKSVNNLYLMGIKEEKKMAKMAFYEAVLNLVLTPLLIISIGLVGAVLASIISLLVVQVFFYLPFLLKKIDMNFSEWYREVFFRNTFVLVITLFTLFYIKFRVGETLDLFSLFALSILSFSSYVLAFFRIVWKRREIEMIDDRNKVVSYFKRIFV